MPRPKKNEQSAEFMIAEFNAIHDRVIGLEQVKANRINFFIILMSAILAGGASVFDIVSESPYFFFIVLGISFLLTVLGFITLDYSLADSITIVNFLRNAGRIRRYFVHKDKELELYAAFHPYDDRPLFRAKGFSFRGSERILLTLNSISFIVCVLTITIMLHLVLPWFGYPIIVIAAFFIFWAIQHAYIKRKLNEAEKLSSERVKFKSSPEIK